MFFTKTLCCPFSSSPDPDVQSCTYMSTNIIRKKYEMHSFDEPGLDQMFMNCMLKLFNHIVLIWMTKIILMMKMTNPRIWREQREQSHQGQLQPSPEPLDPSTSHSVLMLLLLLSLSLIFSSKCILSHYLNNAILNSRSSFI